MNSKWSLNLQCMQICIGPIERSPKGLLGLRLENGNSNVAQSVLLFFARVFLLPFHCELGHEYAEGSGFRYHFPFCRFPFRHGCNSPFVVQWNWIFLRSFLFDLHTDVYVDHTHLIGFEWQIDSHATCESIARGVSWYSRREICPDLSSQVIVRLPFMKLLISF